MYNKCVGPTEQKLEWDSNDFTWKLIWIKYDCFISILFHSNAAMIDILQVAIHLEMNHEAELFFLVYEGNKRHQHVNIGQFNEYKYHA